MNIYSGEKERLVPAERHDITAGIRSVWYEHFKPVMKGGHTHNHCFNVENRKVFRSKRQRKIDPKNKARFVSIWEQNKIMQKLGMKF